MSSSKAAVRPARREQAGRLKKRFQTRSRRILWAAILAFVALFLWCPRPLHSDNFVFYLPTGAKTLPIETLGQVEYLPLLQVLNMVVRVDGMQASQSSLKVWSGPTEVEVHLDDKKVRVNKNSIALHEPVRALNGAWLVPLEFLGSILPRMSRQPIQYRLGTRRIFIGEARPGSFSVRLQPSADRAEVSVEFTQKVGVKTEASNGRWVLFLSGPPLEPLEPKYEFQNPFVKELRFDDQDGVPKLIVTPGAAGLNFYSVLTEDGKVLEAEVTQQGPTITSRPEQTPAKLPQGSPVVSPPAAGQEMPAIEGGSSLPLVVLDPGHGGPDPGAHDKNGTLEKDLVLGLAMRVRAALLGSGGFRVALTRSSDTDPPFDQRDMAANILHAWAFLTFHAGDFGAAKPRIVVYSYQPPSPLPTSEPLPLFIPWEHVQEPVLDRSRQLAESLQQALATVPGLSAPKAAVAPARVLRSVSAPAVAIEIGSFASDTDSSSLGVLTFQQQLADAILKGLNAFKKS